VHRTIPGRHLALRPRSAMACGLRPGPQPHDERAPAASPATALRPGQL